MTNEADAPKPVKVFVVSPIGQVGTEGHRNARYVLEYLVRAALPAPEWEVHRADEGKSPDSIGQHVIRSLHEADLIVADLTGHNPNVFYELAIAHGLKKPVVHLITDGERIPFDIHDLRTIHYLITDLESVERAKTDLRAYAEHAISHVDELVTPMSSFDRFVTIRADQADGGEAVADVLEQIVSRLGIIEGRLEGRLNGRTRPSGIFSTDVRRPGTENEIKMLEHRLIYILDELDQLRADDDGSEKQAARIKVREEAAAEIEEFLPSVIRRRIRRQREIAAENTP